MYNFCMEDSILKKLYIKQKAISIGDKYKALDENEKVVFYVKSKLFSINHKKFIYNDKDELVMTIRRKFFDILPQYFIYDKNGKLVAGIKRKFGLKNKFSIQSWAGEELSVEGNFLTYSLQFYRGGQQIGSLSKKFFQLVDSYQVEILNDSDTQLIVAFVIAFDNLAHNNGRYN